MKRWYVSAILIGCLFLGGQVAMAGDDYGDARYQLGIGGGLVRAATQVARETNPYYTANLRIALANNDDKQEASFRAYIEPEIGYWEHSAPSVSYSDLLLGVNMIGVVPYNAVDFFIGAGLGIHMIDFEVTGIPGLVSVDDSEDAFGVNVQFGVDLKVSENVAIFGADRWDLVDVEAADRQTKIYLGVRFGL